MKFDIPEVPYDLIAKQRNIKRRLWNGEYDLKNPVIRIGWPYKGATNQDPVRRVHDPESDVLTNLENVRYQIECLKASAEVGYVLDNCPAFNMIHFGTGPLATAFGAEMILREGLQPAFEPVVHTHEEAMRLKKPDLFKDGLCPQILERIQYYNEATQGKIILTPCDAAGPWSIATSIWHYEDILEAIYTAPQAVHSLLDMVTECLIEWWNIQEAYIGRWGRAHSSYSVFSPRGVMIGDDCLVTVSPQIWEEFFMPYNNRLSREYGNFITYHCCMRYDTHFESIIKTDGFAGFDATPEYNDFEKIASALEKVHGIWTRSCGPADKNFIRRLRGKVGMQFLVNGKDREDAIQQTRDFLAFLADPNS